MFSMMDPPPVRLGHHPTRHRHADSTHLAPPCLASLGLRGVLHTLESLTIKLTSDYFHDPDPRPAAPGRGRSLRSRSGICPSERRADAE